MNTRIYFHNLPDTVTEKEFVDLFSAHGDVVNLHIAVDPVTNKRRSSGFVTMITVEGARAAVESLNGKVLGAGTLVLSEVPPKGELVNSMKGRAGPRRLASHLY